MNDSIQNYYRKIANIYNDLWFHSEDFVNFIVKNIVEYLNLSSADTFVDLGCGTGIYSQAILKQINLNNPILCVDRSPEMLQQLPSSNKYKTISMDAVGFSQQPGNYEKILIKELLHLINDKKLLFNNLYQRLSPNGILLIILLPSTINYPLFDAALRRYEESQPHYNDLSNILSNIGFTVDIHFVDYPLSINKSKYLNMVENRYMNVLSTFDDTQLQQGISEIKSKYCDRSVFEFSDRFVFITAKKC